MRNIKKALSLLIVILLYSLLYCLKLPEWVLRVPELEDVYFAVGVSNVYLDEETAISNAFYSACYELACQKRSLVKARTIDIHGTDGFVFFEAVIPDSSDIENYLQSAIILDKFTDTRYTYILVASDSVEINRDLINNDECHLLATQFMIDNEYYGQGSSNYISAAGFIYAATRARVDVCEQLHVRINLFSLSGDIDFNIVQKETEIVIKDLKIVGYCVNYRENLITAVAKFVLR